MKKFISFTIIFIFSISVFPPAFADQNSKTGFMVIAQDRGVVGNKETEALFREFEKECQASLTFVGRKYDGIGSEYSEYIQEALSKHSSDKISKLVVLPLFLSNSNHILTKVKKNFDTYSKGSFEIEWAPAMSESYLTSQILLDQLGSISKNPANERLVVLGMGAVDEATEKSIRKEYEKIVDYLKLRMPFKEVNIGLYYDYGVEGKIRKNKNKEVDDMVIHTAAKRGDTLLVPFLIGPKYSHMMSMTHWLGKKFEEFDLQFKHESILTHGNTLLWMKKIANENIIDRSNEKIGVAIMPHGATVPYNQAIEASIRPLEKDYIVEMAYGMGDPFSIQGAISALEKRGAKRIVFVRMYAMSKQFKDKTDYILGLNEVLPEDWKEKFYMDQLPPQVRTSSIIKTFGGYEEDPLLGEIHLERIKEVSKNPDEETIILLAHGAKNDQDDIAWRKAMQTHLNRIQKQNPVPFKKVIALTMREDWPDKRKKAMEEIKKEIELGNKNGRTIIISDRLYGSGPYSHFLKDIDFEINRKGLAPHPNLTRWLEKGIKVAMNKGVLTNSLKNTTGATKFFRLAQAKASEKKGASSSQDISLKAGKTDSSLSKDLPSKDATNNDIEFSKEENVE